MDPIEASCVAVSPSSWAPGSNQQSSCTIVWLSGEHDVFTAAMVSAALREAVTVDGADVVVDLSGVQFMGAAIISVFVHAEGVLRAQARVLRLRRPSQCALRLVELCGLEGWLEGGSEVARATGPVGALGTWVAVPRSVLVDQPDHGVSSESKRLSSAAQGPAKGLGSAAPCR